MRLGLIVVVGALMLGLVGVQTFSVGVGQGLRRAEKVLQPHGLIVLRADGGCDRYLDSEATLTFDRPHRAQFVTAVWPVGPDGGAK